MDPIIIMILVVGLGGLLFMNWRTRKKQQEQLSFRDHLELGQQVQTIGGVFGTITAIEQDRVTIESTPGTEIVFLKQALARLVVDEPETDEDYPDAATDEDFPEGAEPDAETTTSVSPDPGDDAPRSTQN